MNADSLNASCLPYSITTADYCSAFAAKPTREACIWRCAELLFSGHINGTIAAYYPAQQSTDVWATVVANVAPLMALVGERNAKEFMRTVSAWHQLLLLSCAPLGILAIMVSSIRLSGPGFLKRLVGRDSERRSEALVEVTPLSVRPATSVYTPRAVEIESSLNKSGVAYVGGHVKEAESGEAIEAFKNILQTHAASTVADKEDMEAVLVIWSQACSLDQIASLFEYITKAGTENSINFLTSATAAVSYRATGISPTQRESSFSNSWYGLRNTLVSVIALAVLLGVQILGMQFGGTPRSAVYMGLVGYLAIVLLTFLLLLMVKGEIYAEKQKLGSCFDNALWSFSNATHTEHRRMERPAANTLVTARPLEASPTRRLWRKCATTVLTTSLVGAYVTYYISMRVSPWWVSLSGVGVIWIAALYRSLFSPTTIVASQDITASDEYWIGMFGRTLDESLLATIEAAHRRPSKVGNLALPAVPSQSPASVVADEYVLVETEKNAVVEPTSNVFLLVHQPGRTSLNSWSGAEDVIKVGLEVAKLACRTHTNSFPSCELPGNGHWLRLVRMKLAIYVPGLIWRSNHYLDMPLPHSFKLDDVIRHILKIVHVCMDQPGTISRHTVPEDEAIALSHVLCGPIADPPVHKDFAKATTATLREALAALRDNERNTHTRNFSVEQTLLLPTIMLASAYDRWKTAGAAGTGGDGDGHDIEGLQAWHHDKLTLSGITSLPTLQRALARFNVLDDFMVETDPEKSGMTLLARSDSSGQYESTNRGFGWEGMPESAEGYKGVAKDVADRDA
ncbi:hypothetical protein BDV95DRAFT_622089 [Massariosphaeria phaeospora]|uniref:Uncharacterized protein n=1 Tax=Massariosphaeria phaeospora TaxID=100035 RepID=A0A7C8M567_9PLEO|nr:hypothetical protein BDV95DRAFT_622089 [Massariosphaeria phaeospora]